MCVVRKCAYVREAGGRVRVEGGSAAASKKKAYVLCELAGGSLVHVEEHVTHLL